MEIKNIIFDFGGVIVNIDEDALLLGMRGLGISRLTQFFHRKKISETFHRHVDGFVTTDQLYATIRSLSSRKQLTDSEIHSVITCLTGDLIESRLQLLCRLRERYRVILLSNISDLLWTDAVDKLTTAGYPPERCFTDIFVSYKMGVAKPDPAIYEQVISATGILPQETLYFDDREENIRAGESLGFRTVLVPRNRIEEVTDHLPQ